MNLLITKVNNFVYAYCGLRKCIYVYVQMFMHEIPMTLACCRQRKPDLRSL